MARTSVRPVSGMTEIAQSTGRHQMPEIDTSDAIKEIVILGGGTAGWMAATYLSKALQGTVRITVLEAPTIPKIGVGEATVPNLQRAFFDYLEIPEDEWMRSCNAAFKTAVKFVGWRGESGQAKSDHFYHPFGLLPNCDGIPLSHYWALRHRAGEKIAYDYACFKEPPMMDANRAPRYRDGRRATNYAWHFDAHLVAEYLKNMAVKKQGVEHVQDELVGVVHDQRGFITTLTTKSGRRISGDLFIDCSGFRGLLINKAMNEPFVDMSNHLFCDSAVASAVPNDDARTGIEPYTSAIAMKNGWTWKIPMLGRFGTGYVYSSRHAGVDEASREFCELWGLDERKVELNKIRFRVGRNRRAWVKNCVSIGLASCFLEPLESTGIYFIYAAIFQLAKHFPDKHFDSTLIDRFNREIELMFDDTRDFIQAHFVIAPRVDTKFWRDNKTELVHSDNFKEKMAMYKAGLAVNMPITDEKNYYGNFEAEFRNFWTNGSYYCIFAGLGLVPDRPISALLYKPESRRNAEPLFAEVARKQAELVRELPSTYEYLRRLHGKASLRPGPTSAVVPMHGEAQDEERSTTGTRAKP